MEDILKSLAPLSKDSLIKRLDLSPDDLRKAVFHYVYKIAPEYECPEGLSCHGLTPNKNCIYWEGIEKDPGYIREEVEKYKDSYGFCPDLLDFIFFVFDNLGRTKNFSRNNHDCDLWTYIPPINGEYVNIEFKKDKKISPIISYIFSFVEEHFDIKYVKKQRERQREKISEKHYIKCVICGKEKIGLI